MTRDGLAVDTTPPTFRASNTTGTVGAAGFKALELYFAEDIELGAASAGGPVPTVQIRGGGATLFSIPVDNSKPTSPGATGSTGGGTVSVSGAVLTVVPDVNTIYKLAPGTLYSLTLDAGALQDKHGNAIPLMMGIASFTTSSDGTGPVLATTGAHHPDAAATDVPAQ